MRLHHLKNLTEDELAILFYVVNVLEPVNESLKFDMNTVLAIKHDMLMQKLFRADRKIKSLFRPIIQSLISKLSKSWIDEYNELVSNRNSKSTQMEFQSLLDDLMIVNTLEYKYEHQLEFNFNASIV